MQLVCEVVIFLHSHRSHYSACYFQKTLELLSLWDTSDEHGCVCISGLVILAATFSLSSSDSTSSIVLHKVHAFEEHDSLLCILLGVVGQSLNGDVSISVIETCFFT